MAASIVNDNANAHQENGNYVDDARISGVSPLFNHEKTSACVIANSPLESDRYNATRHIQNNNTD